MSESKQYQYTQAHVDEYIALLGCWRYPAPHIVLPDRDRDEYRGFLERCIKVNMNRRDSIGKMERDAARRALRELGK